MAIVIVKNMMVGLRNESWGTGIQNQCLCEWVQILNYIKLILVGDI